MDDSPPLVVDTHLLRMLVRMARSLTSSPHIDPEDIAMEIVLDLLTSNLGLPPTGLLWTMVRHRVIDTVRRQRLETDLQTIHVLTIKPEPNPAPDLSELSELVNRAGLTTVELLELHEHFFERVDRCSLPNLPNALTKLRRASRSQELEIS